MLKREQALVVGSGPNGLSAAITLAQAGFQVLVREAAKVKSAAQARRGGSAEEGP